MTGCQFDCTGSEQRAYRIAMTQRVLVMCSEHASYMTGQGVTLIPVERRTSTLPVIQERRKFVAPWRRNRTAKDLTGALR